MKARCHEADDVTVQQKKISRNVVEEKDNGVVTEFVSASAPRKESLW